MTAPADAGTLTINIAFKGASQRAVWQSTLEAFHKAHPDIDVKATFVDEEAYKVQLPAWLTTVAPDVVNWHAGERMAYYAKRGLFEDLSGDWTKNGWGTMYASTRDASSYNGKQYAAPTVYYSWGLFYRKDLFHKVGIADEPKTWDQFLDACKRLKAAGITPIAVGGRDAWTLAGWFDYLDLRLNGNVFHQQLMAGDVPYTDPRVKKVYTTWKSLIDAGYFIDNALSYDLDGAQPFLFQGKAAMMLMGTFIAAGFPPNVKQEMGYYRFPIIDPKVPTAEDGPVESLHIPTKAKNKADAHVPRVRRDARDGREARGGRLAVGQQQVARAGRSGLAYRLPDPRRYEGRRRAVLRPRHDEGNGRRGDEGDAAVPRESRAARYGARATRTDPQADLQEVTA